MWNRKVLKEEAKKVFTFNKSNYWKMVLVGLIVMVIAGMSSGGASGVSSSIVSIMSSNNSNKTRVERAKTYAPKQYSDISGQTESGSYNVHVGEDGQGTVDVTYTDANGEQKTIHVDGNGMTGSGVYDYDDATDADSDTYRGEYDDAGEYDYDYEYEFDSDYIVPASRRGLFNEFTDFFKYASTTMIIGVVVTIVIVSLILTAISIVVKAFGLNPLLLGCQSFFLRVYDEPADLKHLGDGFKKNYMRNVGTLLLRDVFVALWSLLLIVPGIIKAYEYRMIPYLIAENPDMTYKEAFAKSKEMMTGNKWKAFVLDLSFLGWIILNGLTCGILGIFYVTPYVAATSANLYRALKMGGDTGYKSTQPQQ